VRTDRQAVLLVVDGRKVLHDEFSGLRFARTALATYNHHLRFAETAWFSFTARYSFVCGRSDSKQMSVSIINSLINRFEKQLANNF